MSSKIAVLIALCLAVRVAARAQEQKAQEPTAAEWELLLPEGDGKSYVTGLCASCHGLKTTILQRNNESGWRGVVRSMSERGGHLEEEDVDILSKYLAKHFGENQPALEIPLNLNSASAEQIALLPVISKEKAEELVSARKKNSLKELEDLKPVLSDETIAKIKPFVSF